MKRIAFLALFFAACQTATTPAPAPAPVAAAPAAAATSDVANRSAQLPRTVIDYDHSLLNDNERQVIAKLIDASKQIDEIFWRQVSIQGRPPQ